MARPLKGSLEHKGNSWVASVPIVRGSRKRVSCSYPLERKADAKQWIAAQVDRLNAGLEAEQAPRQDRFESKTPPKSLPTLAPTDTGGPGRFDERDGPDFAEVAESLVVERYELLRTGQAERADDVRRIIRLHLEPVFRGPITLDTAAGRTRVIQWVVACAGRTIDDSPFEPAAKPVKRSTMEERLRVLGMILDQAHRLDRRVENFARGVPAQDPLGHEETTTQLLGLPDAALLAGDLHVIHQFVLWILRILGPRISEPYGLLVEDFIDAGDEAVLLVEAQGGRKFKLWGDQPGQVLIVGRKKGGKTSAAYRLVGIPRQLADLFRIIIAAFHTDPITGKVDLGARLIPGLQSDDGGQHGFRSALSLAGTGSGVVATDERLIPHDIRKNLCADLAWNADVDDILQRRMVGHRAGSDVFAVLYAVDRRLFADLRPAVRALEEQIDNELGGTLLVATSRRPLYGRSWDRDALAHADGVLEEAGWQVRAFGDDWVSTEEAATILGGSVTATRRLFPDQIAAVKHDGNWLAKRDAVEAYRERLKGWWRIEDIVDRTGHDYHQVRSTLIRLGIEGTRDDQTRQLLFTEQDATALVEEFARIDRLKERAVPVPVAAKMLRASQSSIRGWAKAGDRLAFDDENDGSSRQYVTRASIKAELTRRGTGPKQVVTTEELREYAGLTTAGVKALVDQGRLVRVRTGTYTIESAREWATGFRPDLLGTGLLPPV